MNMILPLLLAALVVYSLIKGVSVYDSFVKGAMDALPIILKILPFMATMMIALNVFRDSGVLTFLMNLCAPTFSTLGVPSELVPLIILRPFSGSASMALLNDIFKQTGPDSFASFAGAIIIGSTETIFYTVSLYFGSVGIKKTRHAIPTALLSGLFGVVSGLILSILWYE
ncbi:MAG: spore maturation protein [Clostridia bacterium]